MEYIYIYIYISTLKSGLQIFYLVYVYWPLKKLKNELLKSANKHLLKPVKTCYSLIDWYNSSYVFVD